MLRSFSVTDIGKKRKLNQDYVYVSEKPIGNLPNVFIVADGMGGHNAGEYASKYAVETMIKEIQGCMEDDPIKVLGQAICTANAQVRCRASEDSHLYGMGTTVVAAACFDHYIQVANVGDSRLYIIGKEVRQITMDHSLVEEMVRSGSITPSAARNHPDKNIITRAVGAQDVIEIDYFREEIRPGEFVLLCSDGLTNMLEDVEIGNIIGEDASIEEKAKRLVEAANDNGGKDNIAVILIDAFFGIDR